MSKFFPIQHYEPNSGKYQLLPLRFERITDDNVVVTNAVGEFAFLRRDKLDSLVGHKLHPTDIDYQNLRAKHFLQESGDLASVELLALKTRTKYKNLSSFTNLHLFVVTLRCDHSCQYPPVSD
jgi:hypothetical protein